MTVYVNGNGDTLYIDGFNSSLDTIALDHRAFVWDYAPDYQLPETYAPFQDDWEFIKGGRNAADEDAAIIYHKASGRVWYDPDGHGGIPSQLVADLQSGASLKKWDISFEGFGF